MIRTLTPSRVSHSARTSPVGPAPAIRTGVSGMTLKNREPRGNCDRVGVSPYHSARGHQHALRSFRLAPELRPRRASFGRERLRVVGREAFHQRSFADLDIAKNFVAFRADEQQSSVRVARVGEVTKMIGDAVIE